MNHRARKRFGQNFLHDQRVIDRIVRAFAPRPGQCIAEIGPGLGALTEPLLQLTGRLHVIEIDRDLVEDLRRRFDERLVIHAADALQFDYALLCPAGQRLRLIGNLPYNISTPLLFHLLRYVGHIEDMMFMLQREVVQRMTASPGSRDYGRLSVMLQSYCRLEKVLDVGPGAFRPAPRVDSAVVQLWPHDVALVADADRSAFARVVTAAFAQRRKTLRNTLRGLLEPAALEALGIDPSQRAETLTLEQFRALARRYRQEAEAAA